MPVLERRMLGRERRADARAGAGGGREIGENDCAAGYITPLMSRLDARGASYLGWKKRFGEEAPRACTGTPLS